MRMRFIQPVGRRQVSNHLFSTVSETGSTLLPQHDYRLGRDISYPDFRFTILKEAVATRMENKDSDSDRDKDLNLDLDLGETMPRTRARLGLLECPHGQVETPNFVFCATKAAMKSVTPDMLRAEGTQFILSNTYHLMLAPGADVVRSGGGLQRFTGWKGPMLTDSGGYQIFSMGFGSVSNEIKSSRGANRSPDNPGWQQTLLKITEDGATFRSYVDGSLHHLTPEKSVKLQRELGADFIVVLDECTPFNVDKQYTEDSMRRSHRWALRSLEEFDKGSEIKGALPQAMYGIIQGGVYTDLRDESLSFVNNNPFFGVAIGGSLGANKTDMHSIVSYTASRIEGHRPIHLLGIGGVRDIFNGVRAGVDTFDCVHPSRLARHGGALVRPEYWLELEQEQQQEEKEEKGEVEVEVEGALPLSRKGKGKTKGKMKVKVKEHVSMLNSKMRTDTRPIDPTCTCYTCMTFTRSYIHHLFKCKETLGGTLVTIHNVHYMNRLMGDIRLALKEGDDDLKAAEGRWVHPELSAQLLAQLQEQGQGQEKGGEGGEGEGEGAGRRKEDKDKGKDKGKGKEGKEKGKLSGGAASGSVGKGRGKDRGGGGGNKHSWGVRVLARLARLFK